MWQILDVPLPVDSNWNPVQWALDDSGDLVPLNMNADWELVVTTSASWTSDNNLIEIGWETIVKDNEAYPANEYPLPVWWQYNATPPTYDDWDRVTVQFNDKWEQLVTWAGWVGIPPYTHSSARWDWTAAYASSTTLSLTGGANISNKQLVFVKVTNAAWVSTIYVNWSDDVSLTTSSNTVTIVGAGTPFASGDEYDVGCNLQNKAYDSDLDAYKALKQNQNNFIDVEHVIDSTNDDTTTVRTIIQWKWYRWWSFHLNCGWGVTMTVRASNDSTADDSADTGWVDVGEDWLQMPAAWLVDWEDIYVLDTDVMPERFMIKYVTSDAANATDARINKYNPF